jgi:hypothetical protein
MYLLDYGYLKLIQQERLREAEKQRRVAELLEEARAGKLSDIVRSWERRNQPEDTADARPVHAI